MVPPGLIRAALDESEIIVVVIDCATGIFVDCSESVCRFAGVARDKLVGRHVSKLRIGFPVQTPDQWNSLIERVAATGVLTIEDEYGRADGSTYVARATLSISNVNDRRYLLSIGYKLLPTAPIISRLERESRWQWALFQMANHPAIASGRQAEAMAFIASTAKDMLPSHTCDIWRTSGDQLQLICSHLGAFPAKGITIPFSTNSWLKDSLESGRASSVLDCDVSEAEKPSQRHFLDTLGSSAMIAAPIMSHGEMWGAITLGHRTPRVWTVGDIGFAAEVADQIGHAVAADHRRRMENQLRESELRYRAFVENSTEGIFRIEFPEPIPIDKPPEEIARINWDTGILAECNTALARMHGFDDPGPMLGRRSREYRFCSDEEIRQSIEFVTNGFRLTGQDRIIYLPDGSKRVFSYTSRGVVEHGRLVRLWSTVTDVTKRYQLQEELRSLSARRADLLEQERTRIAREIHDDLGQQLTALKFDAVAWESKKRPLEAGELTTMADKLIQTVRRIATELRPAVLDHFGIGAAVEWQTNEFSRRTGIICTYDIEGEPKLCNNLSTTVFRILQEALTNVARHSKATKVDVSLKSDSRQLQLSIRDNGTGFSTDNSQRLGLGLISMRERAAESGGRVSFTSTGKGVSVVASFPLSADPRATA